MKMASTLIAALLLSSSVLAADPQVLDIDVKGMSCPFCVYNVENKLKALDGVQTATVNLKSGRARIQMQAGQQADPEQLRQAVIDSGFTPGAITDVAAGQ